MSFPISRISGKLTSAPRQFLGRTKFQSLFDDFLLPVLTDHGEDFSNIKPAIFIDTREVARLSSEWIRSMEKNDVNFRVHLNEGLEVTGIRQSKIDATKQLTDESLLETWSYELVLVISELEHDGLIPILRYLARFHIRTPV